MGKILRISNLAEIIFSLNGINSGISFLYKKMATNGGNLLSPIEKGNNV